MLLSGCMQGLKRQKCRTSELRATLYRVSLRKKHDLSHRPLNKALRNPAIIEAATWYAPDPSKVRSSDILNRIKGVCRHPGLHTAVILATPSFAHLLDEDNRFIAKAVHQISDGGFDGLAKRGAPRSFDIRTRSAVVDRLPLDTGLSLRPHHSNRGMEGISILALGSALHSLRAEHTLPGSSPSNAHVRFVAQNGIREQQVVALPVANTMFRNGRQSTCYEDIWKRGAKLQKGTLYQRKSRAALKSFEVAMTTVNNWRFIGMPMWPLTRPCKVGSSIGNVLRELKRMDTGELFPASTDLEVAVPNFLKSPWLTETARAGFSVYALITSDDFYAGVSEETRMGVRPPGRRVLLEALFSGRARLHRVTGGGGGWGNKKGLLSLEPGVDVFAEKDDLLPSLPPEGENYDFQGASALTSTGDNVQFFGVFPGIQDPTDEQLKENGSIPSYLEREAKMIADWRFYRKNVFPRMVIGTNPPDEDHSSAAKSPSVSGDELVCASNYFGMLSEAGACLGSTENANNPCTDEENAPVSFTSRLNIPFTTLLAEASLAHRSTDPRIATGGIGKSLWSGSKIFRPDITYREKDEEQAHESSGPQV